MANRFLSNININDEYTLPSADGTADQIITTDGAGQLSFVDQSTLNSGSASRTEILVKNLEGSALSKGDPVYIIGSVGASERLQVGLADAGDVDKMPCVGLLTQDLANNGEGTAIVTGKLKNLITSPIDGATPTENDTIYVKSGGGLTLTKPTGSTNSIQNVGQVGRVSTSSDGNIVVSAILRTNDVPNLTTGKIWVGTANNTAESTVVHLDEANGRMGIGTTNPTEKLVVNGSINSQFQSGGFATGNKRFFADGYAGGNLARMGALSGASTDPMELAIYTSASGFSGGTERMRIDSLGNVGIGTTSPGYKLEVNGTFSSNAIWTTASSLTEWGSGTTAYGTLTWDVGYAKIFANSGNQLQFAAGGASTDMTIDTSGNVGIGTTSPASKLHITDSAPVLKLQSSSNTSSTVSFDNSSGTRRASLSFIESSDYLSLKNESGSGLVGFTPSQGEFTIGSFAQTGVIITNQSLTLKSNYSTALTCDFAGKVGIGTTSPQEKLHVQNYTTGESHQAMFKGGAVTVGDYSYVSLNNGYSTEYNKEVRLAAVSEQSNSNKTGFAVLTSPDANGASGHERLRVTADGNVGIGTTSPFSKLEVAGDTSFALLTLKSNNGGANDAFMRFFDEGAGGSYSVGQDSSDGKFKIAYDVDGNSLTTGTKLVLDTSGNVGIGTTSPASKLHVSGGDIRLDFNERLQWDNGNTRIQGSSDTRMYLRAPLGYYFETNGGYRVAINGSSGNVGIGTTSPASALHINQTYPQVRLQSTGDNTYTNIGSGSSYMVWDIINPLTNTYQWRSGGSAQMTINTSGNVGIGTTNPGDKLQVEGTIRADSPGTSDWAFLGYNNSNTAASGIWFDNGDGELLLRDDSNNLNVRLRSDSSSYFNGGNVGIGTTSPGTKLDVNGNITLSDPSYTATRGLYGGNGPIITFNGSSFDTQIAGGAIRINPAFQQMNFKVDGNNDFFSHDGGTGETIFSYSGSEKMRIEGNGNVGIGTTSPATKLHVLGTTSSVPAIGAAPSTAQFGDSTYGTLFSTLTSGRGVIQQGRSDGALLTFDLLLNPRGGNVGIGVGTSVPAYTLDVYGTGRFTGDLRCLSLIQTSERDYKKDIRLVGKENSTIPIKEYKYKTGDNDKVRYGVVAEDIESTYPELVERDADGVKGVKYIDLLVRKIAELETEKRTLVNWRHYHGNTSYNTLYDAGMTTAFPYAYGSIPAPYDMYFTSVTLVNNPYSSYNKGPEGETATFQAYVNGKLVYEVREIRYGQNPYESITADFGQNVRLRRGESLQIRFQANGIWRYCNSTIILTEI